MRYDNEMMITMRTAKMAEKAMETLKNRLAAGFDRDKEYTRNPAIRFAEELQIDGRIVKIPFDCGYYTPLDALVVMCELAETLAKNLPTNTFTFENCNCSDYDMSEMVCMAIEEHGWLCDDGHWLTDEELAQWTDEMFVDAFALIYPHFVK